MVDATTLEIIDKTATQLGVEKVPVSWKGLVAVQEEIIRPDVLRSGSLSPLCGLKFYAAIA